MQPGATRERVRCRLITEADREAVIGLLLEGFRSRTRANWEVGLARMAARDVPEGAPRFGYCLDAGGRLVGLILLISSHRLVNGAKAIFTNVASWYVNPDYRAYAQLLVSIALRNKETTYTNISAAPHTWPIVENQGYTRYCEGLFFAAAALKKPAPDVRLLAWSEDFAAMPEAGMLRRHHQMGCRVVICAEGDTLTGFVFRRYCIRGGRLPLPAFLVLHAPGREQLVRLAGNFGRHFIGSGAAFLAIDADGPVPGLTGFYTNRRGRKYFKGPHRPSLCDLTDSEYAIFGV